MYNYIYIFIFFLYLIFFILYSESNLKYYKFFFKLNPKTYNIENFKKYKILYHNYNIILKESLILLKNPVFEIHQSKQLNYRDSWNYYINNFKYIDKWQKDCNNNDWIHYPLIYNDKAISKIPKNTINILTKLKGIRLAGFSWLKPNSEIKEHTDVCGLLTNSLALHMGLIVPNDNSCYLEIDGDKIYEKNKKIIIFDSNYKHRAINNSNFNRIILYIDFSI